MFTFVLLVLNVSVGNIVQGVLPFWGLHNTALISAPSSPETSDGCHPTGVLMYDTGPLLAFVRQIVPGRVMVIQDLSYNLTSAFMGPNIIYYVLQEFEGVTLVIVYYDALLDQDESTFPVSVQWPAGTVRVQQVTVLLESTWRTNNSSQPLNVTVGQSPLMLLFYTP
jgi:hypothetical protein